MQSERDLLAAMASMPVHHEQLLSTLYDSLLMQYSVKRRLSSRQRPWMLAWYVCIACSSDAGRLAANAYCLMFLLPVSRCAITACNSFLWAVCFITYDAAATSLALLFGDRSTNSISRKGLARFFEHLATYQTGARVQEDSTSRISEMVDEVFFYSEALERAGVWRPVDREHGLADSIPIPIAVRFLHKSRKLHTWPLRMVQDQIRKILMGAAYWEAARTEYRCLFGDTDVEKLDLFIVASTIFDLHAKLRQPARKHKRGNSSQADEKGTVEPPLSPTSVSSLPPSPPGASSSDQFGGGPLSSLTLPMGAPKQHEGSKPVPTPRPSFSQRTPATGKQDRQPLDDQLENLENYNAPVIPAWSSIPVS